jgi:hypothetical protein
MQSQIPGPITLPETGTYTLVMSEENADQPVGYPSANDGKLA